MTTPPAPPPPGWYAVEGASYRWWDGTTWAAGPSGPPGGAGGPPAPGRPRRRRRWPYLAGAAALLFVVGLGSGLRFGLGGGGDVPTPGSPEARPASMAMGAVPADLDIRVTYCSPGRVSGWAQGFAVNNGTLPVTVRIIVTFGRSGGTPLGQAPALVESLAPGAAVNWRTGNGPAGDFDTCDVSAVEPA